MTAVYEEDTTLPSADCPSPDDAPTQASSLTKPDITSENVEKNAEKTKDTPQDSDALLVGTCCAPAAVVSSVVVQKVDHVDHSTTTSNSDNVNASQKMSAEQPVAAELYPSPTKNNNEHENCGLIVVAADAVTVTVTNDDDDDPEIIHGGANVHVNVDANSQAREAVMPLKATVPTVAAEAPLNSLKTTTTQAGGSSIIITASSNTNQEKGKQQQEAPAALQAETLTATSSPKLSTTLTGDALARAIERENSKKPSDNLNRFRNILPVKLRTDRDETKNLLRSFDDFEWKPAYGSGGKHGGPSSYTLQCVSHVACQKKIKMLYVQKLGGYILKENGFDHSGVLMISSNRDTNNISGIGEITHRKLLNELWHRGVRTPEEAWNALQQQLINAPGDKISNAPMPTPNQVRSLFRHFQDLEMVNRDDRAATIKNNSHKRPYETTTNADGTACTSSSLLPSNNGHSNNSGASTFIMSNTSRKKQNKTTAIMAPAAKRASSHILPANQNQSATETTTMTTTPVAMPAPNIIHFPGMVASPMQLAQMPNINMNAPVFMNVVATAPNNSNNTRNSNHHKLNLADRIKRAEQQTSGNSYQAPGNFLMRLDALEQDLGIKPASSSKSVDLKTRIAVIEQCIGIE